MCIYIFIKSQDLSLSVLTGLKKSLKILLGHIISFTVE